MGYFFMKELKFSNGISVVLFELNNENRPYNGGLWITANYGLKFTKEDKDGKKETLIPGRKKLEGIKASFDNLERKLKENKPLSESDVKFLPIPAGFKFTVESDSVKSQESISFNSENLSETSLNTTDDKNNESSLELVSSNFSQNSLESISSKQFYEESKDVQQENKNKPSRIPRSISNVSLRNSVDPSLLSTNNTSLFINKANNSERIKKIYSNKYTHTIDVVLSTKDPFLNDIKEYRKTPAISFRDCVRVTDVTKEEMSILKFDNPQKTIFLGNR